MIIIDYDTAVTMVKQLYPSAREPMLSIELELTRGIQRYRPYAVYAKFLLVEYRQIIKADEVTFAYNTNAIKQALLMQKQLDAGDTIPDGQTVDDLMTMLNELECQTCDTTTSNILGVQLF